MLDHDFFIGTWELICWKAALPNGSEIYPLGKTAVGYLIYTADGFVAVSLMKSPIDEPEENLKTHFSYFGAYQMQSDNEISHFIKICSYPTFIDSCQKRNVEKVNANTMILTSPPSDETGQINHLTWKRVKER